MGCLLAVAYVNISLLTCFNRFCAREFERLKKMANAALAYKCVEVAYMKAAFYKHPGAIKDKHALQATSLMVLPGFSAYALTHLVA
jgi:hypothetical protein